MDDFRYRDGELHCEGLSMKAIADAAGTPVFVYSAATLLGHYDRIAEAFAPLRPLICYSIKSCGNLSICRLLGERGAGMDLVSGGELRRAVLAGVDPARCVFAGAGKTDAEIEEALAAGIGWFNIESEQEFEVIAAIARRTKRTCRAALRVNPDVDPRTHRYTSTGKKQTKFGVDIERARAFFASYGRDEHCRLNAIHLHIGSPIYSTEPYVSAINKTLALIDDVTSTLGCRIEALDLGGGFGADYQTAQSPAAIDYAREIVPLLEQRVAQGLQIILEPGRSISGNAGVLLLRVLYVKRSGDKTFVICDGGMNLLIRPALYEAFHFIWPVKVAPEHVPPRRDRSPELPGLETVDVVGPICESGDFLAIDRPMPPVQRGALMAVFTAGAYGMSMANRYNTQPLPAEVLVDGERLKLVRRRERYEDLVEHELEPVQLPVAPLAAARRAGREPTGARP